MKRRQRSKRRARLHRVSREFEIDCHVSQTQLSHNESVVCALPVPVGPAMGLLRRVSQVTNGG